jgi:GxxExxY protein
MTLSHPETNELSSVLIGAAIEVHRELGPGLLESIYEECLYFELESLGVSVRHQESISIIYKGHEIKGTYRPDLVVNDLIVVEAKALEKVLPVHKAQVLTYLKLLKIPVGLLFNFNTELMIDGIVRISL